MRVLEAKLYKIKVKLLRQAFTLMEILISVIIITVVAFSLLEIYSQNRSFAVYINQRPLISLTSTLYNFVDLEKYDKSEKDVYELIRNDFDIKNDSVRQYLKKVKKKIEVKDEKEILEEATYGIGIFSREYRLKDKVTTSFFRLGVKKVNKK